MSNSSASDQDLIFTSSHAEALAVAHSNRIGDFVAATVRFAETILAFGAVDASAVCKCYVGFQRAKRPGFSLRMVAEDLRHYRNGDLLLTNMHYIRHCQRRVTTDLGDTALSLQAELRSRSRLHLPLGLKPRQAYESFGNIATYMRCVTDLLRAPDITQPVTPRSISHAADARLWQQGKLLKPGQR